MNARIGMASLCLLVLTACNDSSAPSAGTGGTASTPQPPAAVTGTARVTLTFPAAAGTSDGMANVKSAGSAARPIAKSYISAKALSVTLRLISVNGAAPATAASATVDVKSGSACNATAGGLSCTLSIDAPPGSDGLEVSTYAQTQGAGGAISIGETTVTLASGTTANVEVILLPVIATVSVAFNPAGLSIATAGIFTATITAKDVTGDVIGGTDNYFKPLTVATADLGAHVSASPALPATLASPQQNTITFTYDGAGTASSYAFTLGGAQSASVAFPFATTLEHLYVVAQFSSPAVYVYDIQSDGAITGPSRIISGTSTTLIRPTKVAVDDKAQVYVLDVDHVAVFAPGASGNVAPLRTLLQGSSPSYVSEGAGAFLTHPDPSDNSNSTVVINYDTDGVTPLTGVAGEIPPYKEAFANGFSSLSPATGRGFLCVSSSIPADGGVGSIKCITSPVQWVSGTSNPGTAQIVDGVANNAVFCCAGLTNDLSFAPNGDLDVAYGVSILGPPAVSTYVFPADLSNQARSVTPIRSITGGETGLATPTSITHDQAGNIYVADTGNASGLGSVRVFAANSDGNVRPVRVVAPLNYPYGIAVGK